MNEQKPIRRLRPQLRTYVDTSKQPFSYGFAIGCGMVAALALCGLAVCLFLMVFSLARS